MKKIFTLLLICIATICLAQDKIPAIITEPGALAALKGHIQGACCSDDAIYLSHIEGIFKLDWNGKVLKHTALPKHTGDICYWKGRIYDSLYNDVDGENNIIVLDDDINIIRSYKAPGGGCATVHNGILYVGTGPRDSNPHRFNNITMFTLEDCRPIATMTLDYGVETRYAAQCLASDGKYIYAVFYATNGGAPGMILTSDLKIVKTIRFNGSTGFDFLPPSRSQGAHPRCFKVSHIGNWRTSGKQPNPAQIRFDFFEVIDGNFVNITE